MHRADYLQLRRGRWSLWLRVRTIRARLGWPGRTPGLEGRERRRDAPRKPAAAAHAGGLGKPRRGTVQSANVAVDAAEGLYAGLLGFDVMCRYPGALFLGAGGYHHRLAGNVWNSRGAPVRDGGTTGLAEVELRAEARTLAAARTRWRDGGLPFVEDGDALLVADPWGTRLRPTPPSVCEGGNPAELPLQDCLSARQGPSGILAAPRRERPYRVPL